MRTKQLYSILLFAILLFLSSCSVNVPENASSVSQKPSIFPDNIDVTIPSNIAPLTFRIDNEGDDFVTKISCGETVAVLAGKSVMPSFKQWKKLIGAASASPIKVEVFVKNNEQWTAFAPFFYYVAPETIDSYISYRLIAPSYVTYEELTINQRNLTNYDESVIYNNMLVGDEVNGQCINCHSYKNYKTDNMQFHVRQYKGGTMMIIDGKVRKINLKTDSTISAGVYPSFNPVCNVIAYSVNDTGQSFHTRNSDKIEVQDLKSDIILYDYDANTVSIIEADTAEFEVFPWWAPDGKTLYYSSAHFVSEDTTGMYEREVIIRYEDFKYDIYRKSFDPVTHRFGPREKVFDASAIQKSATLPRISPDGRYLLFGLGDFGCFHIWHKSSDLYLTDLQTNETRNLKEVNSNDVESYHSWSSNGRWILFTSRRDDGGFTRLYIAYFDKDGNAHKPFEVPQQNPEFYREFYKSYNVPEFMIEPVQVTPQELSEYIRKDAVSAKFLSSSEK